MSVLLIISIVVYLYLSYQYNTHPDIEREEESIDPYR